MYPTLKEAREVLSAKFTGEALEVIINALAPAVGFEPNNSGHVEVGATRIGGTPDVPPGLAWPIRPVPDDVEAHAISGHYDRIKSHLSRPLPFEFLTQVNLGEVPWSHGQRTPLLGELCPGLPTDGRLLFFYDRAVAPWRAGRESCCIIWDRSPVVELVRSAIPPELIELNAGYVANYVEYTNRVSPAARTRPVRPEEVIPAYWRPPQQMRLSPCLTLPAHGTVEAEGNAALRRLLEDTEFFDSYSGLFDDQRRQLLGVPYACNLHDPRVTAAGMEMQPPFDPSDLDTRRARYGEVLRAAADWQLLLQWSLDDVGEAHFVIHRTDLAAGDLTRVFVVYEQ